LKIGAHRACGMTERQCEVQRQAIYGQGFKGDSEVLAKFEKFNHLLAGWCEWIAVGALLVLALVTNIDVVGAKLFTRPLPGAYDAVMLFQIIAVALAAAMTQIIGRHVRVEFVFRLLPKRAQDIIDSIIYLSLLVFFILIVWQSFVLGQSLQAIQVVSQEVEIPLYPFAYVIAVGIIPICLVFLQEFLKSVAMAVKR